MRAFAILLTLGFVAPSFALPTAEKRNVPSLFSKDPLAIHRKSIIPDSVVIVKAASSVFSSAQVEVEAPAPEPVFEEEEEEEDDLDLGDVCSDVCGVQSVPGSSNVREALCSVQGLRATLECAQCIDSAFPETTYEDSAVAEYERIVQVCEGKDARDVALGLL